MRNASKKSKSAGPSAQSSNRGSGQIRIIAGQYRGRRLPVLDQDGLRPTTDRVKETLFNWLMQDIPHSRCLDCFSGSGSLGFEALSRHADFVQFVEMNGAAARQLTKNIHTLGATNCELANQDCLQFLLSPPAQPFNLVFIDPPFRQNLVQGVIDRLIENDWLTPDATVYIETEREHPALVLPSHWHLIKEKIAGQVTSRLYELSP